MKSLSEVLQTEIDSGYASGETLVFPSQLAAEFWRSASLHRWYREGRCSVVRNDRFISWDTFKERTSGSRKDRAPANSALRRLVARRLAADNAASPFLARIIPREYAHDSLLFADMIRQGIPGLQTLIERREHLDAALADDIRELSARYQAILDSTGYFEPAWAPPEVLTGGNRYVIFFPELIEDFPEFAPLVRDRKELREVPLPESIDEHATPVSEYPDSLIELRDVLDRVEALLDSGVAPSAIAVTCGDLDGLRDEIEREARRRDLPLGLRAGVRLSDHPAGQIFARIAECVDKDFHADAVKRLLHHAAIPWRSPPLMHLIARAGIDHGCLGGGKRPASGWYELFDAGFGREYRRRLEAADVPAEEISATFSSLETALRHIARARTFDELRGAIYTFLGRFVDTDQWGEAIEPVFQRCMTVLAEWVETETRSGLSADDPFSLFRGSLSESIYVRKGDYAGIAVYPYRVSAGICPSYHFVIGASRQATTIAETRLPFVREDERERIEQTQQAAGDSGVDPTPGFHRAYSVSGGTVSVSYALKTRAGAQIAPPGVLEAVPGNPDRFELERIAIAGAAARTPASTSDHASPGAAAPKTSYGMSPGAADRPSADRETGSDTFPAPLYPVQRSGYFRYYARASRGSAEDRGRVRDLRYHPVSDSLIQTCSEGFLSEDLRIRLSPSTVQQMTAAPFSLLLSRVAGVEEERWALCLSDPMSDGSLLHRLIRIAEAELTPTGTSYGEADFSILVPLVEEELTRYLGARAISDSPVPARLLAMQSDAFRAQALRVLTRLREMFSAFVPLAQEWKMETALLDGLELSGRADSLSHADGRSMIVDFKRSSASIPSSRAVESFDSPQLPLYVLMAEELGRKVAHAVYVSAGDGKVRVAVGERPETLGKRSDIGISENDWPDRREALIDHVAAVGRRIDDGDFRCPAPWLGCDGCRTRAICRAKYSHRASGQGA